MSITTLQIDDTLFRDALNKLVAHVGDAGKVLKQEAAMLVKELHQQTPPPNQSLGREKVKSDLRKVFLPLDVTDFRTARKEFKMKQKQAARKRKPVENDGTVTLWVTSGGKRFFTSAENLKLNATESDLHKIHQAKRNSIGRVSNVGRRFVKRNSREIYANRVAVKKAVFNRYQRQVLSKVGTMRSGWAEAMQKLGVNVPGWVARRINPRHGSASVKIDGLKSEIEIRNSTPGIVAEMGKRAQWAINIRAGRILRNIERMIKYGPAKDGSSGYYAS